MGRKLTETWKKYQFDIVFMVIAVLAVFSPYMKQDLIVGSDASFHLARIDSLKEGMLSGIFPVKVHTVLCYEYGYGVGFFYPNFFLYIPAALRIIGFSLEVSYKLYAGLLFLALFCSMYYSVLKGTSDRVLALVAGALFLFSNPVLTGFYHGFTLAQNQALIFFPLAVMGMFEFAAKDRKPWMLAAGFTGLIYSHVLSTVMALGVCMMIFLCYAFSWKNWKNKLTELFWAVLIVCGITMAYWGPMLEQFAAQTYKVSQPWTHVDENVVALYDAFTENGLGTVMTIFMVATVLYAGYAWKVIGKEIKISLVLGVGLLLLMTCQPFWSGTGELFDFIQFSSRLKRPAVVLLIFAAVWCCSRFDLSQKIRYLAAGLVLGLCICTGLGRISDDVENIKDFGNTVIYEEIAGLGAGEEWLPVETTREVLVTPLIAFSEDGQSFVGSRDGKDYYFTVSGADCYKLPLIWYKGYRAETDDGTEIVLHKRVQDGLIEVEGVRNDGQERTIHVWYAGTICQKISYMISLFSTMVIIALWFRNCMAGRMNRMVQMDMYTDDFGESVHGSRDLLDTFQKTETWKSKLL